MHGSANASRFAIQNERTGLKLLQYRESPYIQVFIWASFTL